MEDVEYLNETPIIGRGSDISEAWLGNNNYGNLLLILPVELYKFYTYANYVPPYNIPIK